jgi:hypothetical protein
MDASMPNSSELVFQAGTHEDTIRLRFKDWLELVSPLVQIFTEPEHSAPRAECAHREGIGPEASAWTAKWRTEELKRESGQPGGGKGVSTSWDKRESIQAPVHFPRETFPCAPQASSSTASVTRRDTRSKASRN